MEENMFLKAKPIIFENAKKLRNNQTHAELILWGYLKGKPAGLKFRRQHPLGNYIADFYCHSLKLVIEVDGLIHNREDIQQRDMEKQLFVESKGLKIIRFKNEMIELQLERVISELEQIINNTKKPL